MRCLTQVVAVATLVCLTGCEKSLPTAPSELTSGIVIYRHADFEGESAQITRDISDLRDVKGPCPGFEPGVGVGLGGAPTGGNVDYNWNDCISSVRVAPGQ